MAISFLNRFYFLVRQHWVLFILLLLICISCKEKANSADSNESITLSPNISSIRHAVGFDLVDQGDYKTLHLFRHYDESADTLSYVLKKQDVEVVPKHQKFTSIEVPVEDIALLHSSYLSFFTFSGTDHLLKAISEAKYIFDQEIYQKYESGELPVVGYGESLDKERLLEIGVSVVVTVGWPNTPNKGQQTLEDLGIPVLVLSEWQETTLMGRFEWIKLIAALTGKEEIVNTAFLKVERAYDSLKNLVPENATRPSVICNLPYKGSWFMPGGNSYISNVLKDAGANYLWSDDAGTGGIQIDFETVFAKGLDADFWINPGFANSHNQILVKDERLKDFSPVMNGNIFNSNRRISRGIANDYWESGIVEPDVILADLIAIFHPEVLPDRTLFYFKQIK